MGPANQGQNDNGDIKPYIVPRIPLLDTKYRVIFGKESILKSLESSTYLCFL